MHRFVSLLLFSLIVLQTGCTTTTINEPMTVITTEEQLLADVPENWKRVYQMTSRNTRLSDFIREDESEDDWSTKLTFESFINEEIASDPIRMLMSEAESDMSKCDPLQHYNIHSGFENNYETSVRLFLCGENAFTGKGEIKLVKIIKGIEYIYVIRILRNLEPFTAEPPVFGRKEVANWSTFLQKISLCDGSPAHPCPKPPQ